MTPKKQQLAQKRFYKSADKLMDIVEGVRNQRWANERGSRLKDTKEWCNFYVAYCELMRDEQ